MIEYASYVNEATLDRARLLKDTHWHDVPIEDKAFFVDVIRSMSPGDEFDFSNGTVTAILKNHGPVTSPIIPLVHRIIKAVLPRTKDDPEPADWWREL